MGSFDEDYLEILENPNFSDTQVCLSGLLESSEFFAFGIRGW
jgi:hypothetical protein